MHKASIASASMVLALLSGCTLSRDGTGPAPVAEKPAEAAPAVKSPTSAPAASAPAAAEAPAFPDDPTASEAPFLTDLVQLTFPKDFIKAGEAYFDHENPPAWIVFQAVPRPEMGEVADEEHYSMYVARLKRDGSGKVTGIEEPVRISEPGSSNTCGWFHPFVPGMVMYASTITPPSDAPAPGYSRDRQRYSWSFPKEMRIVQQLVGPIAREWLDSGRLGEASDRIKAGVNAVNPDNPIEAGTAEEMMLRAARGARDRAELDRPNGEGYAAECSISPDGRHVLYAYMDPKTQDVDVWVYDTRFGAPEPRHRVLVRAKGYDGGPFFSPDGKRICYRSDREGNNELQLFVADLVFGETGQIIGVDNERRLTTQGGVVNWAPYWSRDGRYLIYASSALGHRNYELFAVDVSDPRRMARVTAAAGFDGLPAFSDDGSLLMWTSQRGPKIEGEARATSQLWLATVRGEPAWREAR